MPEVKPSICRICTSLCPLEVTVEDDGTIGKVTGNRASPIFNGYSCVKGRALDQLHNDPRRLTHHLKRQPDGSFARISAEQLVAEITAKVQTILAERGPRAIAGFLGSPSIEQPASGPLIIAFLQAIGSPMFFTSATLDQPGRAVGDALHGVWQGGRTRTEDWDVFLLIGSNPIVSKSYFSQNPGAHLKKVLENGTKLIVIDPRKSETAKRAHVHLQGIPGEDPTILAGIVHILLQRNNAIDHDFIAENVSGLEAMREAVAGYTPAYVSARAGVREEDLHEAARLLGEAKRGDCGAGTGPSLSTRGTLNWYMMLCIQTLCGLWPRAGDKASRHRVMVPKVEWKAQAGAPRPGWGFGEKLRVRNLTTCAAGLPSAALPEEILTPGEGQIKGLFLHASAMKAWPDTEQTMRALQALDLLVVHDIELSDTAKMAHYVIATKAMFEVPSFSQQGEQLGHPAYGWEEPFAAYQPAVRQPPADWDLLEAWQIYYRVARAMGLQLKCGSVFSDAELPEIDMSNEPTTEELYEIMTHGSVVPLSEIKKHPNGHIFEEARVGVGPRDPDHTARLEVGNADMMALLREIRAEDPLARRKTSADYPFMLIPRRMQNVYNAAYRAPGNFAKRSYNPAFMHPDDLAKLGLRSGDLVTIRSRNGAITGVVEEDEDLRTGLVSLTHGFGRNPGDPTDPRRDGANVNLLTRMDDDYERYTGLPRMGALPVSVTPVEVAVTA